MKHEDILYEDYKGKNSIIYQETMKEQIDITRFITHDLEDYDKSKKYNTEDYDIFFLIYEDKNKEEALKVLSMPWYKKVVIFMDAVDEDIIKLSDAYYSPSSQGDMILFITSIMDVAYIPGAIGVDVYDVCHLFYDHRELKLKKYNKDDIKNIKDLRMKGTILLQLVSSSNPSLHYIESIVDILKANNENLNFLFGTTYTPYMKDNDLFLSLIYE